MEAAQLAVDSEIEQGEVTKAVGELEPDADGPDLGELERGLLADALALVPGDRAVD